MKYQLILICLLLTSACEAQRISFIDTSIRELRKRDPGGEIPASLRQYNRWYEQEMSLCETREYYPDFTQAITDLAIAEGLIADLEVSTPRDSAIVKYQTIWERVNGNQPNEADRPTNQCTINLPWGYYYVWSERSGVPTSAKDRKVYIDCNKVIVLDEQH
ncbi:MAG: hypothetical protein SH856_12040 [Flavobacteriales bacterium]|nr:hypothetical protein [Flavobacteriales bacterium]